MKYFRFIILALVVVFLVYFFFAMNRNTKENEADNSSQRTNQTNFQSKTDTQGSVTITVTPQVLGKDDSQWKFGSYKNCLAVKKFKLTG